MEVIGFFVRHRSNYYNCPEKWGFVRWALPLALPCGLCACRRSCSVTLCFAVAGHSRRVLWEWGWVRLFSRLHGR